MKKMNNNTEKQLKEALNQMHHSMREMNQLQSDLIDIEKIENDTKILAPLSNGIYVKAKIEDAKKLYVNIGSSIVTPQSLEETRVLINKQINEIKKSISETEQALQNVQQTKK